MTEASLCIFQKGSCFAGSRSDAGACCQVFNTGTSLNCVAVSEKHDRVVVGGADKLVSGGFSRGPALPYPLAIWGVDGPGPVEPARYPSCSQDK